MFCVNLDHSGLCLGFNELSNVSTIVFFVSVLTNSVMKFPKCNWNVSTLAFFVKCQLLRTLLSVHLNVNCLGLDDHRNIGLKSN